MRAIDAGEALIVTRNGVPVGELTPIRRRRLATRAAVLAGFGSAAPIDAERFRDDLDSIADQDPTPRA